MTHYVLLPEVFTSRNLNVEGELELGPKLSKNGMQPSQGGSSMSLCRIVTPCPMSCSSRDSDDDLDHKTFQVYKTVAYSSPKTQSSEVKIIFLEVMQRTQDIILGLEMGRNITIC